MDAIVYISMSLQWILMKLCIFIYLIWHDKSSGADYVLLCFVVVQIMFCGKETAGMTIE